MGSLSGAGEVAGDSVVRGGPEDEQMGEFGLKTRKIHFHGRAALFLPLMFSPNMKKQNRLAHFLASSPCPSLSSLTLPHIEKM